MLPQSHTRPPPANLILPLSLLLLLLSLNQSTTILLLLPSSSSCSCSCCCCSIAAAHPAADDDHNAIHYEPSSQHGPRRTVKLLLHKQRRRHRLLLRAATASRRRQRQRGGFGSRFDGRQRQALRNQALGALGGQHGQQRCCLGPLERTRTSGNGGECGVEDMTPRIHDASCCDDWREQCDAALLTAAAARAVATALRPYGSNRHRASADFGPSCQVYQRLRFTCNEIRMRRSLFARARKTAMSHGKFTNNQRRRRSGGCAAHAGAPMLRK